MADNPNYYAIMPANVRYDKTLIPNAKILYSEITALSNQKGVCWATNDYFAKLYSVSTKTVQSWLKSLEKAGYIIRSLVYANDGKTVKSRYIRITASVVQNVPSDPHRENVPPSPRNHGEPPHEIAVDNTTSINKEPYCASDDARKKAELAEKKKKAEAAAKAAKEKQLREDFEKLWGLYPVKKGKKKAFTHYKAAMKDGATNKQIQTGIIKYLQDAKQNYSGPSYLMYGSTFFNQRLWEDEAYTENPPEPPVFDNSDEPKPYETQSVSRGRKTVIIGLWQEYRDVDKVIDKADELYSAKVSAEEVEQYIGNGIRK